MAQQREHWGSRFGMLMAAAGSAIGLGTLWKFPYVTGENGGGAFILTFIICILLIGIPVFIAELILGRHAQKSPVAAFEAIDGKGSPWKIAGWLGVLSSFFIFSYYSVIGGWGLNYILMCVNQFYVGRTADEIEQVFDVLAGSADITVFWHFIFTFITVGIVYQGIRKGLEYWSKLMTSLLLILVFGLFLYNLTLEGFQKAKDFILIPDMAKLKPSSILQALGLSFFTLSLGQGIMITYGSYMRKDDDIPKMAFIVSGMIIAVALLSAFAIFPIMFTFDRPPEGGYGLVFKTLPILFSHLPGSLFISTAFFTLFVFAAITSSIAFLEVVVASCIDLYGWPRKKTVVFTGLATFLIGIPSALSRTDIVFAHWGALYNKTFFGTLDDLVSDWFLPIGGLLIALFTAWRFDKLLCKKEFMTETSMRWFWRPWTFLIKLIAPVGIALIVLQQSGIINIDMLLKR